MVTLQDRILLLFGEEHPAMVCTEIGRVLGVTDDAVRTELRSMAQKGLVDIIERRGSLGVTLTLDGEDARDVFVRTFLNRTRLDPETGLDPDPVLSSH